MLLSSAPVGPFSVLREPLPDSVFVGPVAQTAPAAQEAPEPVGDTADLRDGLRITELMFDPSGGPDYEFVELQNIGTSTLDLTGVRLAGGIDFTFPALTLDPGEFIVVVDDVEDFQSRYGAAVPLGGTFTGNLSDTGELLSLLPPAPDDTPILAFVYDGAWYQEARSGASLVVVDPAADPALWGLQASWRPSTEYGGSPGAEDGTFAPGPIVINELHTNPDVKTEQVEFVELFNPTGGDVDVSGWDFSNGIDYTIPADTTIPSGGYLVVGEDPADILTKFGITALGPYVGSLENEGETVTLRDASGAIVDKADYGLAFPWPTVGDAPGHSAQLIHPSFDNELGGNWRSAAPTPGAANAVLAANAPPIIRQVDHSPNGPHSGEDVAITAKITDVDGVSSVTLEYQPVDPGSYIHLTDPEYATDWTAVPMTDDGLGGDDAANDFVYTAVLPGTLQTHRRLVRYRITIEDATGLAVTVPYADDTQPNFAYYVYDTVPSWAGAIEPGSSDPGKAEVVVYDEALMTSLPIYQLISSKDTIEHCTWIDQYGGSDYPYMGTLVYDGEVYDHIRFRARGGVWRYAMGKNMWKFDFSRGHYFQARDDTGRKYDTTWDKLNFSACIQQGNYLHRGEHGMFEAVGFKMFNLAGVEGPKTHYLQFRIVDEADETGATQYDGDFWGVYLAIEQMDGAFLDEHLLPDGNLYKMEGGTGTLNNQGPTAVSDRSDLDLYMDTYEDTTPTVEWWQNNMDLERYYAYRSVVEGIHHYDIGYGKNYFYYLNPDTGIWSTHPWDLDLTWANNMYGNGNEPFKSRVLPIAEFGRDYQNAMREFMDLLYNTDEGFRLVDDYAALINDPAGGLSLIDADRAMWDYNPIMISSYVNLTKAGQGRFYEKSATGDFEGMAQLMKNYIVSRGTWIETNILTDTHIPDTPTISYTGFPDYAANGLSFQSSAFSSSVTTFAAMAWRVGEITDPLSPAYDPTAEPVYEITSVWESGELTTFAQSVTIPSTAIVPGHTYRARVRMRDAEGRWSHWSDPVEFTAGEIQSEQRDSIRITELMYHPREPVSGPYVDNDYEFLEIRNVGPDPVNLSGMSFTNGLTFDFPDYDLPVGAYAVIVRNLAAFQSRYDTSGMHILGTYTGALDNSGERVRLVGSWGEEIHDFTYNDTWHKITDGDGFSLTIVDAGAEWSAWDVKEGWRPSWLTDGSPGQGDPGLAPGSILIEEVLAHTDGPDGDWLELLNTTDQDMNLGGWCLSDDSDVLTKYIIPADTILPANGRLVFTQTDDFGAAFGFSELGDEAWLTAVDGAQITGFRVSEDFGASEREVSFGRYTTSTGNVDFVAMSGATRGFPNAYPQVGPIVINEIMYNPAAGGDEFIELFNPTASGVDLFDPANPGNTWQFAGGVAYSFPGGVTIPAGGYALVVGSDPAAFRASHGVPAAVPIFGPWTGALDNGGESVRLYKPGDPEPDGFVPTILVERVKYDDELPWPARTDGEGSSLSRAVSLDYGNDPDNWRSSTTGGTPGEANILIDSTPPSVPDGLVADPVSHEQIDLSWDPSADPVSGVAYYQVYRDGAPLGTSTAASYSDSGVLEDLAYTYRVSAVNGDGFESAQSAAILATPRPSLQGVQTLDESHVRAIFGKPLDRTSAVTLAHYGIVDDGGLPVAISAASVDAGDRSVTLTLGESLVEDVTYTLSVASVTDTFGNPVAPTTSLDFTYAAWVHEDIGNVAAAGDMLYVGGVFTIEGSGADIWGYNDEFHFVHRSWYGDVEVTARVVSLTNTSNWAKAGVMIRDSLATNSAHAMTVFTPGNGIAFQRRVYEGGASSHTAAGGGAHWVRVVRIGDMLTGYKSADGVSWVYINSVSVPMSAEVEIGLAVTSHNDGAIATAVIDNVEVRAVEAPVISVDSVSMTEGDSGATEAAFTVTLSRAASMPVSVAYATLAGSATAGSDFDGVSGGLTFNPGSALSQTVRVTVHGDAEPESLETFTLELLDPRNCTLDPAQGVGAILDDDVNDPLALNIGTDVFVGGELAVDGPAAHSLGILGLDVNGNVATTLHALRTAAGWLRLVEHSSGRWDALADGVDPQWHTADTWAGTRLRGLDPDASYTFHATARNDSGAESTEIEVGTYGTCAEGDLDDSGSSTGVDFAVARHYILAGGALGTDIPWRLDVNDDGEADGGDIVHIRDILTGG